jgi:hypothetical protein
MGRLLSIGFIWAGCAVAWILLGSSIVERTGGADGNLRGEVYRLWGTPQRQLTPQATWWDTTHRMVQESVQDNRGSWVQQTVSKEELVARPLELAASDLAVSLHLEQRQKGLLWFPTYTVGFDGTYTFTNATAEAHDVEVTMPLEQTNTLYDGFAVLGEDGKERQVSFEHGGATVRDHFDAGASHQYRIAYRSRGTTSWSYQLTQGTAQVRKFKLSMETDFADVDFPSGTLSPTVQGRDHGQWKGAWTFASLVANADIGVQMPQKLNPGEVAARITFFAPIGLLFFFFVVAVLATASKRAIHPMNYFLFGCAFFAFHLLFAYLADQVPLWASFGVASLASVGLVVSYGRLFVGWRFALLEMGLSQLIYLVLFSGTFFWTGYTGLAITVMAVLTLFVIMQITGRVNWADVAVLPKEPTMPPAATPAPSQA